MARVACLIGATFVQTARGIRVDRGALTLVELAPATLFVGAGPAADLGHVSTGEFLDCWPDAVEAVAAAPIGVLSLLDAAARLTGDAVMTLRRPRIAAAGLRYEMELLRGTLPTSSGAAVLFVNPSTTPVTPTSTWRTPRALA